MAIREFIVEHTNMVLDRSRPPEDEAPRDVSDGLVARVRELMLQIFKLGFEVSGSTTPILLRSFRTVGVT